VRGGGRATWRTGETSTGLLPEAAADRPAAQPSPGLRSARPAAAPAPSAPVC